ncbi:hypothetical protein ANTRET_LOCUS5643 [Anthophora retusa]
MTRREGKVMKKLRRRKVQNVKPMKIAALIVSAIQDLRETKGLTPNKIVGYINYVSDAAEGQVKRKVKAVLQRGVEYGILRRYRGHYFLPTGDELYRANRIALRFAKLPLPAAYFAKLNMSLSRKIAPMGSRRRTGKSGVSSRKMKRFLKPRAFSISPTVSLVNTICNADNL